MRRWDSRSTCSRCCSRFRAPPAGLRSGRRCSRTRIRRSRGRGSSTSDTNAAITWRGRSADDRARARTAVAILIRTALALIAALVGCTYGLETATPRFDGGRAYGDLREIVAIGPRPSGSAALAQTREYITKQL